MRLAQNGQFCDIWVYEVMNSRTKVPACLFVIPVFLTCIFSYSNDSGLENLNTESWFYMKKG